MVEPGDIHRVLGDAARLVSDGRIVVFGSAALAFRIPNPPSTRDIDIWCEPPDRGDVVTALMGETSWYHEKHGSYIEVWGPETFAAPTDWRERAEVLTNADSPGVALWVPHPHDVLMAKLERWEPNDRVHAGLILAAIPMSVAEFERYLVTSPYRTGVIAKADRCQRFEAHAAELRRGLG